MPTSAKKDSWYSTGGPWGTGLLCIGLAITVQGIAYMGAQPGELRSALAWISQPIPMFFWGLLWVIAGAYSIWHALTPPQRHAELIPAVGVISLWSAFYLVYWLNLGLFQHTWTRDWTVSVAWGCLAAVLISFGRCVNPPTGRRGRK